MFKKVGLNRKLGIMLAINIGWSVSIGLFMPFYAVFVGEIGGSILDIGLAFAVYSITVGLMIALFAVITDRIRKYSKMLILAGAIITIGTFSYIFVQNSFQLMIVQFILGVGTALSEGPFGAVYVSSVEKQKEAFQSAMWTVTYQITLGISALIAPIVLSLGGFKTLFLIMTGVQIMTTILIFVFRREIDIKSYYVGTLKVGKNKKG